MLSSMRNIPTELSRYFAEIGRKGGATSRRTLSSETARDMVRVREARRAFRKYHAECFWYMPRDMDISKDDVPAIAKGLRQNGGRRGYMIAESLCR